MADAKKKADGPYPAGPSRRDRIVIGASAGSLDTLRAIAGQFPRDFPGTIFIVAILGKVAVPCRTCSEGPANSQPRICRRRKRSKGATSTWHLPIDIC